MGLLDRRHWNIVLHTLNVRHGWWSNHCRLMVRWLTKVNNKPMTMVHLVHNRIVNGNLIGVMQNHTIKTLARFSKAGVRNDIHAANIAGANETATACMRRFESVNVGKTEINPEKRPE